MERSLSERMCEVGDRKRYLWGRWHMRVLLCDGCCFDCMGMRGCATTECTDVCTFGSVLHPPSDLMCVPPNKCAPPYPCLQYYGGPPSDMTLCYMSMEEVAAETAYDFGGSSSMRWCYQLVDCDGLASG